MPKDEFIPRSGPAVTLEGVPIVYKNFMGQRGTYNEEGERSFNVIIEDPDLAQTLADDGFNLKQFLDEDEQVTAWHFRVKVNYGTPERPQRRPPRVYRVTQEGRRQQLLTEQTVGMLDSVDVAVVDLTIGTWIWREGPLPNVSAYCNVLYAHVEEDPLDAKYAAMLDGSHFDNQ